MGRLLRPLPCYSKHSLERKEILFFNRRPKDESRRALASLQLCLDSSGKLVENRLGSLKRGDGKTYFSSPGPVPNKDPRLLGSGLASHALCHSDRCQAEFDRGSIEAAFLHSTEPGVAQGCSIYLRLFVQLHQGIEARLLRGTQRRSKRLHTGAKPLALRHYAFSGEAILIARVEICCRSNWFGMKVKLRSDLLFIGPRLRLILHCLQSVLVIGVLQFFVGLKAAGAQFAWALCRILSCQ